jgi:protein-tyrosine phosphatase
VRHAPDRWLHAARRRALLESLGRRPSLGCILFVCYGNLCRSPFAAALLRRLLRGAGPRVTSAGFGYAGRRAPPVALAEAARFGVDLSSHRSQLLSPAVVRAAQVVFTMEPAHARSIIVGFGRAPGDVVVLGDLDPDPIITRAVTDPVQGPPELFAAVYARIERCVASLASALPLPGR